MLLVALLLSDKKIEYEVNTMKKCLLLLVILVLSSALLLVACDTEESAKTVTLNPENPVTITVWHYYSQDLLAAFDALVAEFNETIGREQGIFVESSSQGSVTDLEKAVLSAAKKEVGASNVPNVFAAYPDTVYALDQLGVVSDISPYFSAADLDLYVDSYIEEGRLSNDEELKIFPIAKSVEVMIISDTDWQPFAAATGATYEDLSTIEGVTAAAASYYEWTDAQTETPNDGQALFGRDAIANYFYISAMQLGQGLINRDGENITVNFDQETIRKIWDNYYIPYVKGHFYSYGRFRSDDVKMGQLISYVGSSTSASFMPKEVAISDSEKYAIEMIALEAPKFANGEDYAVQQGAGMVVTEASEAEIYASVVFLKWFTETERNIEFSLQSGYLPVTKEANDIERIRPFVDENSDVWMVLEKAIDTVNNNTLYIPPAFAGSNNFRNVLTTALNDKSVADREAVLLMMESGSSYEDAIAAFTTEENFLAWYDATKSQLEALVAVE